MASSQNVPIKVTSSGASVEISYNTFTSEAPSESCPIILLHSMVQTKEVWNNVAQDLSNKTNRTVYAYDARNHGLSEYSEEFNFELNVEDLLSFMDEKKIEKAVLIGHSMGGQTASRTALKKPERVEAIVSEEMFVKIPSDFFPEIVRFVERYISCCEKVPKEVSPGDATDKLFDIMDSEEEKGSSVYEEIKVLRKLNLILKQKSDGTYGVNFNKDVILKALKNPDSLMKEPEGQCEAPALFVYGSDSTFKVGDEKENILKHFPSAQFYEVSGSKHHVHLEKEAQFVDKVVEFLKA